MAHATNDINAVTMFAGGGVMSCSGCVCHSLGDPGQHVFHD